MESGSVTRGYSRVVASKHQPALHWSVDIGRMEGLAASHDDSTRQLLDIGSPSDESKVTRRAVVDQSEPMACLELYNGNQPPPTSLSEGHKAKAKGSAETTETLDRQATKLR